MSPTTNENPESWDATLFQQTPRLARSVQNHDLGHRGALLACHRSSSQGSEKGLDLLIFEVDIWPRVRHYCRGD